VPPRAGSHPAPAGPRPLRRAALALALAWWCTGCPGPTFDHAGPASKEGARSAPDPEAHVMSRGLPPPRLQVVPARPIVGWLAPSQVTRHTAAPGGGMRLELRTQEDERVIIAYDLGDGRAFPVTRGDEVLVRYFPTPSGRTRGDALVLADSEGRALAIVARWDGLPPGVLPGEARIARSEQADRVAYVEVRRTPSLCLARTEHADLELATEARSFYVPPGGERRVVLQGATFDLLAYDASRPLEGDCGVEDPSHTSWALLATAPQDAAPREPTP